MDKSDIKSLAKDIENLIDVVKKMRRETRSRELKSVLKYVYNRLDSADTELYVYMDSDEDE